MVGHSLGGGVAALFTTLLKERFRLPDDRIHCYAFGSPACVNDNLAAKCENNVTAVVLHDDLVPRIGPSSVRLLLKVLRQVVCCTVVYSRVSGTGERETKLG